MIGKGPLIRRILLLSVAAVLAFSSVVPPVTAQITRNRTRACFPLVALFAGCDLAVSTKHVWRGITRRDAVVVQPDVFLAWGGEHGYFTAGGWVNIELDTADPSDPSGVGLGRRLSQWAPWVQVNVFSGPVDVAVGYTRYFFDVQAAASARSIVFNTGEVFGSVQLEMALPRQLLGPGAAITPRFAVWYDHEDVKGWYIEPAIDIQVPLFPLLSMWFPSPFPALHLRAAVGVSDGQASDSAAPMPNGYFVTNGVTHWDFSAGTTIVIVNAFSAAVEYHLQRNRDGNTRGRTSLGQSNVNDAWKHWFRFSVSYIP